MRKVLVAISFSCSLIGLTKSVNAQLKLPALERIRALMTNCSIDYSMKCTYPDGQVMNIKGMLAVSGNQFYDSSNTRFVLQNKEWYIIADHLEKTISVLDLRKINEQLDDLAMATSTSFLFNDDFFSLFEKLDVMKQNTDTSWFRVRLKDSSVIQRLDIQALRSDLTPVSYSVVMNYPIGGYESDGSESVVKVAVNCFNIQSPAKKSLFSTDRIIGGTAKAPQLKRFNNYKTYK